MTAILREKFKDYHHYHTNKMNCYTHYLGIPLIAISLFGLLFKLKVNGFSLGESEILTLNAGSILAILAFIFYFTLDKKISLLFLPVIIIMYVIGTQLNTSTLVVMQVIGWISQYVGHLVYEKKSPAFYKNVQHILIGPLWIFCKLTGIFKYKD